MNYGMSTILAISFAGTVYNAQFDLYHQAMQQIQEIDQIHHTALNAAEKLKADILSYKETK